MKHFLKYGSIWIASAFFSIIISLTLIEMAYSADVVYRWKVVNVYDGDTFKVERKFFPPELGRINVRIRGIDTGELGWRAACEFEAKNAILSANYLTELIQGKSVEVTNIKPDKYGARVVADVFIDGKNVAELMLAKNLAKPYDGTKKLGWCNGY